MEPLTPAPVVLNPLDIDKYGFVRSQREELEKLEKLLKANLDACIPADLAATDKWSFDGEEWVIGISAREWKRTFTGLNKLYRRLGHKAFFAHCKFNLGDFDKLVPEGERSRFVESKQSGPRTYTLVKKFRSPA